MSNKKLAEQNLFIIEKPSVKYVKFVVVKRRNRMEECIETWDARELILYGLSDEHPDRQCFNCGDPIDVDRIEAPERTGGLLLCPECGAGKDQFEPIEE